VLVAPILPGLSDRPDQVQAVVKACVAAGAVSLAAIPLHLRPGVRDHYLTWLASYRPDLVADHKRRYRSSYLPKDDRQALAALVHRTIREAGGLAVDPTETRLPDAADMPGTKPPASASAPLEPQGEQLGLGV
jgi:DNA repair photolyase